MGRQSAAVQLVGFFFFPSLNLPFLVLGTRLQKGESPSSHSSREWNLEYECERLSLQGTKGPAR